MEPGYRVSRPRARNRVLCRGRADLQALGLCPSALSRLGQLSDDRGQWSAGVPDRRAARGPASGLQERRTGELLALNADLVDAAPERFTQLDSDLLSALVGSASGATSERQEPFSRRVGRSLSLIGDHGDLRDTLTLLCGIGAVAGRPDRVRAGGGHRAEGEAGRQVHGEPGDRPGCGALNAVCHDPGYAEAPDAGST